MNYRKQILICLLILASMNSGAKAFDGGTNIGGGSGRSTDITNWCSSIYTILESYYSDEVTPRIVEGDLLGARQIMMNGLIESMKSDPAPGQSLSSRALIRGVEISNAVSDIEKNDPSGVAFSVQVLQGYYEFLLRKVRLLDPEASHLNFSRTREPLSIITIEKNAEKYVLETPKWLMSFTEKTHEMYLPKPSARIFLKMAELISTYALEDFSNSLMKHKYDCVEIRLKNLKEKIVKYNLGSRTFSNDKVAVNVVATALDSIIKQMNSGCESEFNSRKE